MTTYEIITLIVLFCSPVFAVFAAQYLQNWKMKREEKTRLFLDLLSDRHLKHLSNLWVQRLNQVPVIFRKNHEVARRYEHFLSVVNGANPNVTQAQLDECLHDLFHEIAKEVGYSALRQTDFARFYFPSSLQDKVQGELALYEFYLNNKYETAMQEEAAKKEREEKPVSPTNAE